MSQAQELERKSSAITLSDMEVFIFPEVMYSLVLANLMSPRLWRWRDDPWFDGLKKMTPYRRITRVKQYIMDHYAFNLDLDTWGLTTKERELARFSGFIDRETLARSNALFGYEGDKYYFDIDIRTHFGLDKYEGNVIPYWKTETVEAMDAFRFKPNYATGAGECVSLSTLYAAALFVVAGIPLNDIFLMATPLHSQNFVDEKDGILTNNRRLVTKNMWFNGTALSAQARRALENEQVTVVTHESGYIHVLYPEATIHPDRYARFTHQLRRFLRTPLTAEILGNFLRHNRDIQHCFQVRWPAQGGVDHYLPVERAFDYEAGGSFLLTDDTRAKLMGEVESEDLHPQPLPSRIVLNDLEAYISERKPDMGKEADLDELKGQFACDCLNAQFAIESLITFCRVEPRLPDPAPKTFARYAEPLGVDPKMAREQIIARLESIRDKNPMADLAFYAYRDLNRTSAGPFLLAAAERNPVSLKGCEGLDDGEVLRRIEAMPAESIYDEAGRLAQPDEVWNFGRGDGAEKALLLANILRSRHASEPMSVDVAPDRALLRAGSREYRFASAKQLRPQTWPIPQRLTSGL